MPTLAQEFAPFRDNLTQQYANYYDENYPQGAQIGQTDAIRRFFADKGLEGIDLGAVKSIADAHFGGSIPRALEYRYGPGYQILEDPSHPGDTNYFLAKPQDPSRIDATYTGANAAQYPLWRDQRQGAPSLMGGIMGGDSGAFGMLLKGLVGAGVADFTGLSDLLGGGADITGGVDQWGNSIGGGFQGGVGTPGAGDFFDGFNLDGINAGDFPTIDGTIGNVTNTGDITGGVDQYGQSIDARNIQSVANPNYVDNGGLMRDPNMGPNFVGDTNPADWATITNADGTVANALTGEQMSSFQNWFRNLGVTPSPGTALSRIMSGNATTEDWIRTLGTIGGTIGSVITGNERSDSLQRLYEQNLAIGAPSRARYEASYAPGFDLAAADPAYQGALDQSMNAYLRRASTGGNPFSNPGVSMEANRYVTQNTALPWLQNYRNQNASSGGMSAFSTAAPASGQTAATNQGQGLTNLFGGISDLLNPQQRGNSLDDLLRQYGAGAPRMNTGGIT